MTGLAPALNGPAADLYRQTLRKQLRGLFNDVNMPGKQAQAGRKWLDEKQPTIEALEQCRARTQALITQTKADRELAAARAQEKLAA